MTGWRWTDEERLLRIVRSPAARVVGFVVGLTGLGFLVVRFVQMPAHEVAVLRGQTTTSLLAGLAAYCTFNLLTVLLLRFIVSGAAGPMWAAAQLVKYLPLPGSAMFGMVGKAVQEGHGGRKALEYMTRHTLLLVAGSVMVGSVAAGAAAQLAVARLGAPVTVLVAVGGLVLGGVAAGPAFRWSRLSMTVLAAAGWGGLGTAMWLTAGGALGSPIMVTSAFAAAWAVGLLALPVPAGLGVREAVLVLLLAPEIGQDGAIAFGVMTRALHVVSDAAVALPIILVARRRTPRAPVGGDAS